MALYQPAMNCKPSPFLWVLENLEEGSENEFIEFLDIRDKFDSNVSSFVIGNVLKTLFKKITIKSGRSKKDWSKSTQRYYGISWIRDLEVHSGTEFINIASLLPPEFFCYNNEYEGN